MIETRSQPASHQASAIFVSVTGERCCIFMYLFFKLLCLTQPVYCKTMLLSRTIVLYLFGYRSAAPTVNRSSSALRVSDSAGTADEDAEQIELFVIAAYPNTRVPAIIPPALGMAGGKWNSPLCAVILLDLPPPPFLLTPFILGA